MGNFPGAVLDRAADAVRVVVPVLAGCIPPGPAAQLGRLGASRGLGLGQLRGERRQGFRGLAVGPARPGGHHEPAVVAAVRELGPLPVERLLGALELPVRRLDRVEVPGLSDLLGPPPASGMLGFASSSSVSEAVTAADLLERLRPGVADLVDGLTRGVIEHPSIVAVLPVAADGADEAGIAAQHGATYVALAVAAARLVVDQARTPDLVNAAAAAVGLGIGAAVILLREVPMPAGYAAARLAQIRAEYLLPRAAHGTVPVSGHRFALAEGLLPATVDFTGNGLVAVVDGGAVIRTGIAAGHVPVRLNVLQQEPGDVEPGWEEVVDVSWHAAQGLASVVGPDGTGVPSLQGQTPPWPDTYRLRVQARGRDDPAEDEAERYELAVWAAPAAPQIVHRCTDRLGHRLRGEPEPVRHPRPEHAYRWIRRSSLAMAATVTVVTGATVEQVLRAFGADPDRPENINDLFDPADPWVTVLDTGLAVLAVEFNGYQGADEAVLAAASTGGRAASMFWNINALTRLSFADHGRLLESFEPFGPIDTELEVAAVLAGLDFADYADKPEKGLVAVERFTGRGITAADLDRIEATAVAYPIRDH